MSWGDDVVDKDYRRDPDRPRSNHVPDADSCNDERCDCPGHAVRLGAERPETLAEESLEFLGTTG